MVKLTETAVYLRTKTSVENVKKLNLWGCCIDDISLCSQMPLLEVLSISVNEVSSLEPLQHCKNLRELYLRKNAINNINELNYLKGLPNLTVLWLAENPCAVENDIYRRHVVSILPQLTKLDDKPVTPNDRLAILDDSSIIDYPRSRRESVDMMSRSMYVTSSGPTVFDRAIQPQILHFDTSEDETSSNMAKSTHNQHFSQDAQSSHDDEMDDWQDFSIDEDREVKQGRMFQSMHDGILLVSDNSHNPNYLINNVRRASYSRSVSLPRPRRIMRPMSTSPARSQRNAKLISAISTLLDELDPEHLRKVIDDIHERIKKQR